jgi:hypothetical protein
VHKYNKAINNRSYAAVPPCINTPDNDVVVVAVEVAATIPVCPHQEHLVHTSWHLDKAAVRLQGPWHYYNQPVAAAVADILAVAVVGIRELRKLRAGAAVEENNPVVAAAAAAAVAENTEEAKHHQPPMAASHLHQMRPNRSCRASLFLPAAALLLVQLPEGPLQQQHHYSMPVADLAPVDACAFHNCRHLF